MTRKGLGSVYQLKSGKWRGSIEVGYAEGKRKRRTVSGSSSQEVTRKLKALQIRYSRGELGGTDNPMLSTFLAEWLDSSVKPQRAPRTYLAYESALRLHIVPLLGTKRVQDLTPQQIQRAIGDLMISDSAATARYAAKVLKTALVRAYKWGLITRNPGDMVDLPGTRSRETLIWTQDEARAFLSVCDRAPEGALFTVILALALRKGEALALRWPDVDLNRGTLTVRGTLQHIDGVLTAKAPKTDAAVRTLHIPDVARPALLSRRERTPDALGYVFTNQYGRPYPPQHLDRPFRSLVEAAGVPLITIHGLRHTTATALLERGVPVHLVSKMLGHASVTITLNVYAHALAKSKRDLAGEIDAIFGAASLDVLPGAA